MRQPQPHLRQKGVLLIELALTLPIILLLIFAIVQYAVVLGAMIVMNNTVSEAARQATVYRSGASVADYEQVARDALSTLLPTYIGSFKTIVQADVQPTACGDSTCLKLTLSYPDYSGNPLLGNAMFLPLPTSLSAQATTRVEPDGS
ncbi:TadE/TadG family type IV pilus assembly protein [Limnobacter litoralis]|uniref:TadE-like domain-containing protein n=1 Tax=Limnobacter litoralis TaxID=481366 RepID=A0ABQ5YUC6_9BURK|nr:TadE/TadG family type IV pilus assembly protein [Limnobacter litoralis]GLR26488.1 hypothetical protein GCM10007875_15780 [Limnobacter litoralis]